MTLHEDFGQEGIPQGSSNRGFGLVFATAFTLLAAYLAFHGSKWWGLSLIAAGAFAGAAYFCPGALSPLNHAWTRFGLLLAKVTTPIMLLLLFIICFVPIGLVARLSGKDFLRLRPSPDIQSYWIVRDSQTAGRTNMKNQF